MAIPGTANGIYTADGLEHNEKGTPSSMPMDHKQQLDKRRDKLERIVADDHWAEIRGEGKTCIVTWGSSSGASFEAARRLAAAGTPVKVVAIRLISPLPESLFKVALSDTQRILVVEQNHAGQLFHYLHSMNLLPDSTRVLAKPGPLPIRPQEITNTLSEWS